MKNTIYLASIFLAFGLTACEKPTVVNVPAATVAVPGPAGPQGDAGVQGNKGNTGNQGNDGTKGDTGKTGDSTTVIVVPPADTTK